MDPNVSPQPMPEHQQASGMPEAPKTPEVLPAAPSENSPQVAQGAPAPMPVLPQVPTPDPAVATGTPASTPITDTPAIADDVDVIEKEWVDKAQEVIEKTKDDPYQEEEQIESLQVDYLKKRYGKELKKEDG